jgi:hypothetical protein
VQLQPYPDAAIKPENVADPIKREKNSLGGTFSI